MGWQLKYDFITVFAQLCIVKVRILVQSWKLPRAEAVAEWCYCVHNGARLHFYAFAYSRWYLICCCYDIFKIIKVFRESESS